MAQRTIQDRGSDSAAYEIDRRDLSMTVTVRTTDGPRTVHLDRARVLAIGTGAQRTAVGNWLDAAYAAAPADLGFA